MKPLHKSLLHAAGFVGLLVVLWFVARPLDVGPDQHGVLGAYGHELLLDIGIAITLAVSLNLILGIAGQFSLGHAGFVAAGAYTSILISGKFFESLLRFFSMGPFHFSTAVSFQLIMVCGMLAGSLVAAVLGLVVGLPTLRLRGDYLAIATLGFGEILAVIFINFTWNGEQTLGGSTGLSLMSMRAEWVAGQADPDAALPTAVQAYMDNTSYFVGVFAVFAVALLTIYIVHNIKYATSGRALLALREDPVASESVGIPTTRYKVAAFVIGAALAGLAGGLVSHHKSLVNPESFRFMRSIELVAMVILGGQGSITGSILAAIVLTLMPEALRSYVTPAAANTLAYVHLTGAAAWVKTLDIEKWRMVLYSLFIIFAMLFMPRGLFGRYEISDLARWIFRRPKRGKAVVNREWAIPMRKTDGVSDAPLLAAKDITMQFGGLRAIDHFNLELRAGELVGLIGPNGAGKTTVFNVLTGVYRPTKGAIAVSGVGTRRKKPHSISWLGLARTFQNIRLFANLSVLDNVMIAQHAHHKQGMPSAIFRRPAFYREEEQSRADAMEYLGIFHLQQLAEERAGSLSYGDQRRLEIARALATRPKLLLLDEPAAGMNPTEKRELMELIRSIRGRFSLSILLIEHDMKVVMGVCQRIVVLDYGRTIAMGTPAEIRQNAAVITAYLGASAKQV